MQQHNIIAVDVGRRRTKFAAMKGDTPLSHEMHSIVAEAHNETFGIQDPAAAAAKRIKFSINNTDYDFFLSDLAARHGHKPETFGQENWFKLPAYRGLTYAAIGHAIHLAELPHTGQYTLIIGLPIQQFFESIEGKMTRDVLSELFSGNHSFSFRGKVHNLNINALVLPQSYASFIDQVADFNGEDIQPEISNSRCGIIDIGGESVDLSTIDCREVPLPASRGDWKGVNRLISKIQRQVKKEYGRNLNPVETDALLTQEPFLLHAGQTLDLTDMIESLRLEWQEEIIQFINPQDADDGWQPATMAQMIFVGGATKLLDEDAIKQHFPHAVFAENPGRTNVTGMLKYGIGYAMEQAPNDHQAKKAA